MKILYLSSLQIGILIYGLTISQNLTRFFLFSDNEGYLTDEDFKGVTVFKSNGYFGGALNFVGSSSINFSVK